MPNAGGNKLSVLHPTGPAGDPPGNYPGRFGQQKRPWGGVAATLPQVTTLPASQLTATTAWLNGSLNPEGLDTSWWFMWGVDTTYSSGTTPIIDGGVGSFPVTVTAQLTGLVTGQTYHYALVGQSAAGKLMGADQTFTPTAIQPVTLANVPIPSVLPVAQPHFNYPFRMTLKGAAVNEQESIDDVYSCVKAIVDCPVGGLPDMPPGFGFPDETFSDIPVDPRTIVSAISRWEPRANAEVIVQALNPDSGVMQIGITATGGTGASNSVNATVAGQALDGGNATGSTITQNIDGGTAQ